MSHHPRTSRDWSCRNYRRRGELAAAWSDLLSRMPWELFVTLTFDPKRVFPVDRIQASREAFWWCCETARIYRTPIAWAYAPERGASGLWHVHALLAGTPPGLTAAAPMWKERNGHIDVRPVWEIRGATLYASKSAAATGEIVWSDTCLASEAVIAALDLHPMDESSNPVDFGTQRAVMPATRRA
jgi:hypothetical protein